MLDDNEEKRVTEAKSFNGTFSNSQMESITRIVSRLTFKFSIGSIFDWP